MNEIEKPTHFLDKEGKKQELDILAEKNKENPIFVKELRKAILREILVLTFSEFYSQRAEDIMKDTIKGTSLTEDIPDVVIRFNSDLAEATKEFTQVNQIESYCKSQGIKFPPEEKIQRLKRSVAFILKTVQPNILKK